MKRIRSFSTICFVTFLQISACSAFILKDVLIDDQSSVTALHEQSLCHRINGANQEPTSCSAYWQGGKPPVVLISMDGFRPEYLKRSRLDGKGPAASTILCLARNGVRVPYMMPSYPTITFPNHYSMVTGLYPESHGIIHNRFFDPDLKAYFNIRSPDATTDPKWWRNGEPIWATAKRQGRISATYFWPGSDVKDDQRAPNYRFAYNKSTPYEKRVDQILDWLDLPIKERPNILTLYFEDPDSIGHKAGPNTRNVTEKVTVVDRQIRRLVDGLLKKNRLGCVNLILVSDHGMAESPAGQQLVDLEKYVKDLDDSALVYYGPLTSIRPRNEDGETERIRTALRCQDDHMRVWTKWELPYRLHSYRSNRIPSLMLDMDLGWRAMFKTEQYQSAGDHGWDNLYEEMHAIFVAHGPSFRNDMTAKPFENIELYNLMCALVDVKPAANNGTWGALHHLLVEPPTGQLAATDDQLSISGSLNNSLNYEEQLLNQTSSPLNLNEGNFTEDNDTELLRTHAPFGVPVAATNESERLGLLINRDYITGFDYDVHLPLWIEYTLAGDKDGSNSSVLEHENQTWTADPRIEQQAEHSNESAAGDVEYVHFFPKELASRVEEVWLESNRLQLPEGASHLTDTMTELLRETQMRRNRPINVISGRSRHLYPALYYIVSACSSSDDGDLAHCRVEDLDVQAFLLPIRNRYRGRCLHSRKFIAYHVATLKDVENVSGLRFFPRMPADEKLQLMSWTTQQSRLVLDPTRYARKKFNEL